MHEHLKDIPVAERPKMVALFPWGAAYFRAWHTLRWFLGLLLPVTGSAVALWVHGHGIGVSLFVGFLGAFVAAGLFVALCSGMASSNWGTHFREREPRQYWVQVAVMGVVYLALSVAGPVTSKPATPPLPVPPLLMELLSPDPKVLHIVSPAGSGTQTIGSLHPKDNPSSSSETEIAGTISSFSCTIIEQTPSSYRVAFQRTIVKSGTIAAPQREIVTFPFRKITHARVLGSIDITGFYGHGCQKP
jgi:hypothetical protein